MRKILLFVVVSLLIRFGYAQNEGWAICNSGANLYFRIVGSGPPVLLVGDAGNSSHYLSELVVQLSHTNRVVLYDPRAIGKSRFPVINDSTINFAKAVADIEALRSVLRIPRWSVVGHGFGAKLAGVYAAQYPQKIGQLVLINPTPITSVSSAIEDPFFDTFGEYSFSNMLPENTQSQYFQNFREQLQTFPTDSSARLKAILDYQVATFVHDTLHQSLAAYFLEEKLRNRAIKNKISTNATPKQWNYVHQLREQKVAVMVLLPNQRNNVDALYEEWKAALPQATISKIDCAHHFPWLDNPSDFYSQVVPFLKRFNPELYASEKKVSRIVGRGYQRRKRD
ncbi:MAG: alpha/beta fold hydrolase [Runella sp.]